MKRFYFAALFGLLLTLAASAQLYQPIGPIGINNAAPSWSLDFTTGSLPSGVTFTGPANAAYYASNGNLSLSTLNTPRFDYDPVALTRRGLLYEPILSANQNQHSQTLSDWSATRSTKTTSATTGPDGTSSAITLKEDATASNTHFLDNFSNKPPKLSLAGNVAMTAFVKQLVGTRNVFLRVSDSTFSSTVSAGINPSTGAVVTAVSANGTFSAPQMSVVQSSNGWWEVTIAAKTNTTASIDEEIFMCSAPCVTSYTGDNTSTVGVYGVSLDYSPHFLSNSLIQTSGSIGTRTPDTLTITVPTGQNSVVVTFDDNSTQSFILKKGAAVLPPLNRPWIKKIQGFPYSSPAAPTIASAAGLTTATFYQTFSAVNTDINSTGNPGYQWYTLGWPFDNGGWTTSPSTNFSFANGVVSFGSNASFVGEDTVTPTAYLQSIIGTRWTGFILPPADMYVEVGALIDTTIENSTTNGSTAIWLGDMREQFMVLDNVSDVSTGEGCEIDISEWFKPGGVGASTQSHTHDWTSVSPPNNNVGATASLAPSLSFHVYSMLLQLAVNHGGTGTITYYVDGVQTGATPLPSYTATTGSTPAATPANPNGVFSTCDTAQFILMIHAAVGNTTPMQVQYAHVFN